MLLCVVVVVVLAVVLVFVATTVVVVDLSSVAAVDQPPCRNSTQVHQSEDDELVSWVEAQLSSSSLFKLCDWQGWGAFGSRKNLPYVERSAQNQGM